MDKIRKRSFTSYQNSSQLQQTLLNQVLEQHNAQTLENINSESQKNIKFLTLGLIKSKKAKVLSKFQRLHQRTARNSTQNGNPSTIQSLKKEIIALQSDQVLSYRLQTQYKQQKQEDQQKCIDSESEISAIIRKFNKMKKESTTDKFRKKLLYFKGGKLNTQIKTERQSIKSQRVQTRSDQFLISKRKINLSQSTYFKIKQKKLQIESQKNKSSMSLTARRFYDSKTKANKMNQSCCNLYDRENSIKKVNLLKKTFSRSVFTF